FSKVIQVLDSHTVRIVRTISATTTTPKLYTRIRRSYDCTLTPPASEIRLAAPANPLAFTCPFYQTGSRAQHQCFCSEKRIYYHYKQFKKCNCCRRRNQCCSAEADRNLGYRDFGIRIHLFIVILALLL